jgi:hypothetical protein
MNSYHYLVETLEFWSARGGIARATVIRKGSERPKVAWEVAPIPRVV